MQREQPLTLDLCDMSLNRLPLGAAGMELSKFGRPLNKKPFKERLFLYDRLGIIIELKDDRVHYFGFPVRKLDTDPVGPCVVSVVFPDHAEILVTDNTTVDTLLPHLPSPTEVDADEEETDYLFTLQEDQLELEVSPEGHVCRLNLFREFA